MTPLPKVSFIQIVKYPVTWLMMMAVFGFGYILDIFVDVSAKGKNDCEVEKAVLREEKNELKKEKADLINAILVKTEFIKAVHQKADSIITNTKK